MIRSKTLKGMNAFTTVTPLSDSREAMHRFRTANNAKSILEIKGRNSIFFREMTL